MARLEQPKTLSDAQKAKVCIEDLKVWVSEMGIDSANLEELLVQDVMQARDEMAKRGLPNEEPSVDESKSKSRSVTRLCVS